MNMNMNMYLNNNNNNNNDDYQSTGIVSAIAIINRDYNAIQYRSLMK